MSNQVPVSSVKPDDVSVKEFWAALDLSLSQITSFPFVKNGSAASSRDSAFNIKHQDPAFTKLKPILKKDPLKVPEIVTGESIKIIKLSATTKSSSGSGISSNIIGGVNHLNLIQIKGNPIHAWQPKLTVDHMNVISVSRPNLNCAQINKLLLKNENIVPSYYYV